MGKAEDVARREKLAAERNRRELELKEQAEKAAVVTALREEIHRYIPRVLKRKEAEGYTGATLLAVPRVKRYHQNPLLKRKIAGWCIAQYATRQYDDYVTTYVYLLVDGRIFWGGSVDTWQTMPEFHLEMIRDGLKAAIES